MRAIAPLKRLTTRLSTICLLPTLVAAGFVIPTVPAHAISNGCAAVNAGGLDQTGVPLLANKSVSGAFYAGDVLTVTFSSSAALPLSVVSLSTTGPQRQTTSLELPLLGTGPYSRTLTIAGNGTTTGAEAGILALGSILGITINLTVRCSGVVGPTTTTLTSAPNPAVIGQNSVFSATVATPAGSGQTPNGNVTFNIGGTNYGPVALNASGVATYSTSTLPPGSYAATAAYAGNSNFVASSGTLASAQVVNRANTTTSVTASSNPTFGSAVTFTATTSAVAPGGGTPTGNVIFTIGGVDQAPVALSNGTATLSRSNLPVGATSVSARYDATTNYNASSGTLSGGVTVATAATTTTLSGPGSMAFGTVPTITATVAGAGGTPTGTVVFTVDGQARPAVTLSSGTASISLPGLSVGAHTVSAAYSGATSYATSTGTLSGGQPVTAAPTSLAVAASPATGIYGSASTFTASVTSAGGVPTGNVVFTVDGVAQAPIALSGGTASFTSSVLAAGTHTVSAAYQGSTNFLASSGALASSYTVGKATPSLAVTSSANPAVAGQAIQLTANVTATSGTPSGDVVFTIDGVARPAVTLNNGSATVSLPSLAVGDHTVSVRYAGDSSFVERTSTLGGGQKVNPGNTALTLTSSGASAAYGAPVTITANVAAAAPASGTVGGQVVFIMDGTAQPAVTMTNGQAQLVLNTLAPGAHTISAAYQGSSDFNASTASLSGGVTINAASTTTSIALDNATISYGQTARVTATVTAASGRPAGQIVYTINGVARPAIALADGVAALDLSGLAAGTYAISAAYGGSANHVASASGTTQLVVGAAATQLGVTASSQSPRFGDPVTFTASLTSAGGTPAGSVEFFAGSTSLGTAALNNGTAALTLSTLPVGSPAITARYAGSANFAASAGTLGGSFAVTGRVPDMTVSVSPSSAAYGQDLAATITVSSAAGTPQGNVTLTVGDRQYPATLNGSGTAAVTLSALAPGSFAVSASYAGQSPFLAASASANAITITRAATAMTVVSGANGYVFGDSLQLRANVTSGFGTPAGGVVFTVDGTDYPASLTDGSASVAIPGIAAGQHAVSTRYAGSTTHQPATATLAGGIEVVAAATQLNLTSSAPSISFGSGVTVTAALGSPSGNAAGNIVFSVDGTDYGTVPVSNGAAQLRLDGLTVGNHAVAARYVPAAGFQPSSAQLSGGISVVAAAVTASITPPQGQIVAGQSARFAIAVSSSAGVPSGQVIPIVDGVDQAPITISNGQASFDYSFATAGNHTVGLRYGGSESFAAATGAVQGGVTVVGASSTLSLAADPSAPVFGQSTRLVATVTSPLGTPGGLVTFSRGGTTIGSAPLTNGVASVTLGDLAPGTSAITASYAGDAAHVGANAALNLSVANAATTLALSANPTTLYAGAPVTFTANITSPAGAVPGSVVFVIGGTEYAAAISGGVATLTLTNLPVGTPTVSARFDGQPGFAASQATLGATLTIQPPPTDIEVHAQVPRSVAGQSLSISLSATGGVAPYRFAVTAGALPAGVTLDPATGAVTGTPTQPGNYSFTVTASGAAGQPGTVAVNLAVLAPATLTVPQLSGGTYGQSLSANLAASGGTGPYQYALSGNLPAGVTFDPATATLSGTPTALGTFNLSLQVTDANGFSLTRNLPLTIAPPTLTATAQLPEAGAFVAYSGQISVSGGTAPYGYAVTTGALPEGLSLDPTSGAISGTPRRVGAVDFTVTATDVNGFTTSIPTRIAVAQVFTVVLPDALAAARQLRPYGQALRASGGTAPYVYSVSAGTLPVGLVVDDATGTLSGTPSRAGNFSFTLSASDANGVTGSKAYTLSVAEAATLVPDTDFSPAIAGTAYEQAIGVSGGTAPYGFGLVSGSLPDGLVFNAATGVISGTATEDGNFPVVIQITDANGDTITQSFMVVVQAPEIAVSLDLPAAEAGAPFAGSVSVTGGAGPFAYALTGALPAGLSFDPETGVIAGTPSGVGSFPIRITVTDANGYAQSATGTIEITAATTLSLTASETSITFGDSVELRAAVAAAGSDLAGRVIFTVDGNDHAGVDLSGGEARLSLQGLTVGSHAIAARFEPGNGFIASSAELAGPITVIAAPVSIAIAAPQGDIVASTAARFTAKVSSGAGTVTGQVIPVVDGLEQSAVTLVEGAAAFDLSFATSGNHAVSLRYSGSDSFAASTGALQGGVMVTGATSEIALSVNPTAPGFGQPVTLTANVSSDFGSPTGLVTFTRDGAEIGSVPLSDGVVSLTLSDLPPGGSTITATYQGDGARQGSSATLTVDLTDAATALSISATPTRAYAGAPVSFTANLSSDAGVPAGEVTFIIGDTDYPAPIVNGVATLSLSDLAEGNYAVTARFAGQPGFAASEAALAANLVIDPAPTDIAVSAQVPRSVAGESAVIAISATGGVAPYAFSVSQGALPDGLVLDAATGTITGVPTTPGDYSFTISVSGQAGAQGSVVVNLIVLAPVDFAAPPALPEVVFGEAFTADLAVDGGTAPIQYVLTGTLPAGVTFDASTGTLSGTPATVGRFELSLTVTDANGFTQTFAPVLEIVAPRIEIGADLPEAGAYVPYAGQISVSGGSAPYAYTVSAGALPDGLSLDPQTGAIAGTSRMVGEASFTVTVTDANGFTASLPLSISVEQVFAVALPDAIAGGRQFQPFGQSLAATGGTAPYDYAVSAGALPAGLSLDAATGVLSGTPSGSGNFNFTLTATDANGVSGSASYSLNIAEAATLSMEGTIAPAVAGIPYSQVLEINGGTGPYGFALVSGTLPAGFSFDAGTGTISGTATEDGSFPLVIQIMDANGDSVTQTVVISVAAPDIEFSLDLPAARAGERFESNVVVSGGAQPLRFSLDGALPAGLSFDAGTGTIAGTPSGTGTFPITVTVIDANGYEQSASATIALSAATSLSLSTSTPTVSFGSPAQVQAAVTSSASDISGRVIFSVDGAVYSSVPVTGGVAQLDLSALTVGNHAVTARFESDSGFDGAEAALAGGITVTAAPVLVNVAGPAGGATVGAAVPFTVTVNSLSGVPGGEVIPVIDGVDQPAIALVDSVAAFTHVFATAGTHSVAVRYPGNESFAAGSAALGGLEVTGATSEVSLSASPATPSFGAPVTITANVSTSYGTATGLVVFSRDGTEIGSVPVTDGLASLVLNDLPAGASTITATYQGDAASAGASAQIDLTLADAATALALTANPTTLYAGEPVTFSATLTSDAGPVGGSVIFTIGGSEYPAAITGNVASLTLNNLSAGNYPIGVRFGGAPGFAASQATLADAIVVEPAPSDIVVHASVPRSVAGESLSIALSAVGGVGPYGFVITDGALPAGLTLNPATGSITGAPTETGSYSFTVTATGQAGAPGSERVNVTVLAPATLTVPALPGAATYGENYQANLGASGGTAPYQYALSGNLPAGMSFDAATGALSGTPQALGTFPLSLSIVDANGFVLTQALELVIAAPVISVSADLPDGGAFVPYAGQIVASGGMAPYSFAVTDGTLPQGLSLDPQSGAISGTPRVVGEVGFTVTVTDANGFTASAPVSFAVAQVFAVTLPQDLATGRQFQPYGQVLAATGGTAPYDYAVSAGALPDGLVLDAATGTISGMPSASGSFGFTLSATDANGVAGSASYTLEVAQAATLSMSADLAPAVAGAPYSQALNVSGGTAPYRFTLVSGGLPAGLSFDPATGTFSGTATEDGTFPVAIRITDTNNDSATQTLVLRVEAPEIAVALDLPAAVAGEAFAGSVSVTGGAEPFDFVVTGALPEGLSFDAVTGAIAGTPMEAGTFPITVTATDANGYAQSAQATIVVTAETSLSLTASNAAISFGDSVQVTALVSSAASISGNVVFSIDGVERAPVPLANGAAELNLASLTVGSHSVSARFEPSNGISGSSAELAGGISVTAAAASVTVNGPAGNVIAGEPVQFTVAVSSPAGTPHGEVVPVVDGVELASVLLVDGQASFSASFASSGNHSISVRYPGSDSFAAATGVLQSGVDVAGAASEVSLASSPSTPVLGQPVTVAATVTSGSGTPGGQVVFSLNGVAVATVPVIGGVASLTLTDLTTGANTITASYQGDAARLGSEAKIDIVLGDVATTLAISAEPTTLYAGAPVTFTAMISSDAGAVPGSVVFVVGGTEYAVEINGGVASLTLSDLSAGSYPVSVRFDGQPGFAASAATLDNDIVVEPAPSDIVVSAQVPRSVAGESVAIAISATGGVGPYAYALAGDLPEGMSFDPQTGAISGVPANPGSYRFTVTVSGSAGTPGSVDVALTVLAPAEISVTASMPSAIYGETFNADLSASGGTATYQYQLSGTLPAGVSFDAQTATLSGTPSAVGNFDLVLTVTDANGFVASQQLALSVAAPEIAISADLPDAGAFATYAGQFGVTGGSEPYGFAITGGALPDGLSLDPQTGVISGTPRMVGEASFTVTVTDANGFSASLPVSLNVEQVFTITLPSDLADGREGQAYGQSLAASGGTAPYGYAITSGSLPGGMTLDAQSGALSGTPDAPGSYGFTITATDANGATGSASYTLVVAQAATLIPDTALDSPVAGMPYRKLLAVAGGRAPYRFALVSGSLPPGMSFDAATGTISGTATEAGNFGFVVAITDADGASVTQSFALDVEAPAIDVVLDLPVAGAGEPFQGAAVITGGAQPYSFALSGALPAGLSFDAATGVISGTPSQAGSFPITIVVTDANGFEQSVQAQIEVQDTVAPTELVVGDIDPTAISGTDYAQTIAISGGTAPYAFAIAGGALPDGLVLDPATGSISGTPLQTGRFGVLLDVTDSAGNRVQRSFVLEVGAPAFTPDFPAAIPAATGGGAYDTSVAVTGTAPITYTVSQGALPPGLSLDPASGSITGTPSQAGSFSFEITATDAHEQSASASYTLTVEAPQFQITGILPAATGGESYDATLAPSGGTAPYRFTLASPLPAGMVFDPSTGRFSGMPTVAGDFNIAVQVTDAVGFANTINVPLSIAAPVITLDGILPEARIGTSFLFTPNASGGTPDYRFALASGALPAGLSFDAGSGTISGLPLLAETSGFTLSVTDANGFSATRSFSLLVVSNLGNAVLPGSISDGQVGAPFSGSVAAIGGAPLTYAVTSGALPQGLALDPASGVISGTPERAGTALFTVTATDSSGRSNAQHYVMAIAAPAMVIENSFPLGTVGQSYSDGIAVAGGIAPYSYTLSNAPRDLTIDPRTGVISGLPRETGSFDVVVTVTDALGHSARQGGTLNVQRKALALLLRDIAPNAATGEVYDSSLAASNGIGTITYEVIDGELPEGVTMSPDGELTGSPRRVGRWAFTIRAVDSEGNMGTRAYAMEVADGPVDDSTLAIDVTLDPEVAELGSAVRFEVTVTNDGEPATSGAVSLVDQDSGEIIDSTVLGSAGTATFTFVTETAGQRSFVVQYTGAPGIAGGTSDPVILTTNPATTSLSLSADPQSPSAGQEITLSAVVERVSPAMGSISSGNVIFSVDGEDIATVPVSDGLATTTITLPAGSSDIAARFEPDDDNDLGSEDALTIAVRGTATIVLSGPQGTVSSDTPLTYTATVSASADGPAPTGTVSFLVDGAEVASASLSNGAASVTLDPLPAGSHQVSAVYSGDDIYDAVTSEPVSVTVEPAAAQPQATTTALTPSTGTPVVGDPVTLTATVSGSQPTRPSGIVRFIDQTTGTGIGTGTLNGDGQATLLHRFTTADTRTISAEYQGDALNLPSRDQFTFNIVPSPTQISLFADADSVSPEGTTALTAQFSRLPNGRGPPRVEVIEFRADNVVFASVPSDGDTAVTVESPPIEMTTQFTANLVPEAASQTDLPSSSAPVEVSINAAGLEETVTDLTIAPNPSVPGQQVTLQAEVNAVSGGPATGSVRFIQGQTPVDTVALTNGVATIVVSDLPPGTTGITAQFIGNATYDTSTDTEVATVNPPAGQPYLTIVGSAQPNVVAGAGQPVTLSLQIGAQGNTVTGIGLSIPGATDYSCPTTILAAGATMTCTATYITSFADIGQGNLSITATAISDNAAPVSTTITVASQVNDVVDTFEDLTNQFISTRARMVTGISLPNVFDRRIAPSGNRPGSINAQGNGTSQTYQFATSLEQWRGFANSQPDGGPAVALEPSPINAWVDMRLALHGSQDDAQQWSRLAVAAAGVDYLVNDNLLIGVAAQGDWMVDHTAGSEFTGAGYLIGPYASIGLAENVSLDLALFYGQSFNEARADIGGITYTGEFETDRLLAMAGLSGFYELNEFILRPSATFFLSSERSGSYVVSDADGNSVPIPEQEIMDLQVRGGLTIERTIELDDGAKLTPMVGLNVSYGGTLDESGFDDRLTGGVMAGLLYSNGNFSAKGSIEAEFSTDGFEGATGRITISGKF